MRKAELRSIVNGKSVLMGFAYVEDQGEGVYLLSIDAFVNSDLSRRMGKTGKCDFHICFKEND